MPDLGLQSRPTELVGVGSLNSGPGMGSGSVYWSSVYYVLYVLYYIILYCVLCIVRPWRRQPFGRLSTDTPCFGRAVDRGARHAWFGGVED